MLSKLRAHLSFANVVATIALFAAIGAGTALAVDAQDPVPPGETVFGAIGGDYHNYDAAESVDFGAVASLPLRAAPGDRIRDGDVSVDVESWQDGGGQATPTSADNDPACTGTPTFPTAPEGQVCIYVAGSDGAQNLEGFAVNFGTRGSRDGFKLKWDASGDPGDSFVDATWAYTAPD